MAYTNYRFHLSSDTQLGDQHKTIEKIERVLKAAKELKLSRIAFDLDSENKTISILSKSNKAESVQNQVTQLLLAEQITLFNTPEIETLGDHEKKAHNHEHGTCPKNHDETKKSNHPHEEDAHHHSHDHSHHHDHDHGDSHENHWLKATLGLIWGIGLLVISLGGFTLPLTAYYLISGFSALMTLYLGRTVYQSAWNALMNKKWDITTLYTISTLTIAIVSVLSIFIPGLPMMLEAAPLVLGFWHLGEGIEHSLIGEINKKLDVRDCVPPLVLLKSNPNKEISIKKLIPNDIIIIKKGDVLPVDGVLNQKALLYTTKIDGSPDLKEFYPGDVVSAGMRLAEHLTSLEMRVTKTFQNSYLSLIAKNIDQANAEKAPIEQFANKILTYFIPGLIAVAIISGIVIGLLFTPALAIQCVVSVLVSACPCALSLITPMAVKIGMKKATDHGIQFKNGKSLQSAADIDTIVFDLNGTLTEGKITVSALNIDIANEKYLNHFALLESQTKHPVAKIIKSYIKQQAMASSESLEISCVDKSHHSGLKALINDDLFMIGNKDMLLEHGITHFDTPYDKPENGSIYMVKGSSVIGQIALSDPLRKDALATVNQLKKMGKNIHICTGADKGFAEYYASLLGIPKENICSNTVGAITKPNQMSKSDYIKELQSKGCKVAMVGDAANDLTAITTSDIGIAVKSSIGDEITQQYAGIVVQKGLLFPIATAFDVAQKSRQNIFQNLFISLTYNSIITLVAAGLFVAIGFALNPAVGVALMVLESTIVLANLYRFKRQDIVTATEQERPDLIETEREKHSTIQVLNALNHSPQLDNDIEVETDSPSFIYQENNMFTPATLNNVPSNDSEMADEDLEINRAYS